MTLPKSILEISDVLGRPAALKIVKAYGGSELRVPLGRKENGKTRQELITLLGEASANLFIQHYGGERVPVPRCQAEFQALRDLEIINAYGAGESVRDIAVRHCMTVRNVRNILKRTPNVSPEV